MKSALGKFPTLIYYAHLVVEYTPFAHLANAQPSLETTSAKAYSSDTTKLLCRISYTSYYDLSTKQIKISSHVCFDKGMNDLPTLPFNAKHLIRAQRGKPFPQETKTPYGIDHDLDSTDHLFAILETVTVPITRNQINFGFILATCDHRLRVFTPSVLVTRSTASKIKNVTRKFRNAYNAEINNVPVFSEEDATAAFLSVCNNPSAAT